MAIMLPTVVTALLAGSGPNSRPCRPQLGVEPLVDHARLHADRFCVDADHAAKMGGEIDHQPRPERFAGHARAGAAGVDGDVFFGGVLHAGRHVGRRARPDHRQRLDLVDAGVAGEELQEDVVAANLAGDQPAQIVLDAFALLVEWSCRHQAARGYQPSSTDDLRKSASSVPHGSRTWCGNSPSWPK